MRLEKQSGPDFEEAGLLICWILSSKQDGFIRDVSARE